MPTVLLTGANRGIGLEFVRQYAGEGWRIIAGCRDPQGATELQELASSQGNIEVRSLEVSDEAAIKRLAEELAGTPVDLLLLNAGVIGSECASLGQMNQADWLRVLTINTVAPALMIQAFREHVAASELKTIVALSSILGSITNNDTGGLYSYRASKSALNHICRSAAIDLREQGIKVLPVHPGWVQTDMGGPDAQISTETSVSGLIRVIGKATDKQSGKLIDYRGKEMGW